MKAVFLLGLLLVLSVRATAHAACPDAEDIPVGLGLEPDGWHSACLEHPKGMTVLTAVRQRSDGPVLEVVVAIAQKPKPALSRVLVDLPEVRAVLSAANDVFPLEVRLIAEDLGGPAVRVSIGSTTGEDLMEVQEIAVLFALREAQPRHLWSGLGALAENRFDMCFYDSRATFELLKLRRLKRTIVTERTLLKPQLDREIARDVRAHCTKRRTKIDTIELKGQE